MLLTFLFVFSHILLGWTLLEIKQSYASNFLHSGNVITSLLEVFVTQQFTYFTNGIMKIIKKVLPPVFKSGIAQINFNAYQLCMSYKLTWHTLLPLIPVEIFQKIRKREKNC